MQPVIQHFNPEEQACLYSLAFGAPVKTSIELAIENPPDRSRQMVYKLVRDKKELLGVRRAKETFLNGQQLHECCLEMIASKQPLSMDFVWRFLEEKSNRMFGVGQWDRGVLN